jgi:L-seryl-tRNA(Ser) seleniumtransferase
VHDLGSGLLIDAATLGLPYEPTPMDSLRDGADVVTMSGDKLLGGPQAGIILGRNELIDRMRRNPLCRALRVDKMTLAALEATLTLYLDPERACREIPVLSMLTQSRDKITERAEALAAALRMRGIAADTAPGASAVGGGAFPAAPLPTTVVRISVSDHLPERLDRELRAASPPIVARVAEDRLVIDLRTVLTGEDGIVLQTLVRLLA